MSKQPYKTPDDLVKLYESERPNVPSLGVGFKKTTLDPVLLGLLQNQLAMNIQRFKSEVATPFLRTENDRAHPSLFYQDTAFNERLLQDLQPVHEEWSGVRLKPVVCYGIRVYQAGSYLFSHCDHSKTHVVSSTICIASELNEPWPLYIEDGDGKAHEVDMGPGDMVLFEGARLIHGRPYAMDGTFFASIFVHFVPTDWVTDGA